MSASWWKWMLRHLNQPARVADDTSSRTNGEAAERARRDAENRLLDEQHRADQVRRARDVFAAEIADVIARGKPT